MYASASLMPATAAEVPAKRRRAAFEGDEHGANDSGAPAASAVGVSVAAIPSDTLAALHLLKAQFPSLPGVPPFALKTQLYTVLQDHTAADRELDDLRRANAVRVLKLPSGPEDYAVIFTADYAVAVEAARAELEAKATVAQRPLLSVFAWFVQRVLPACCDVVVTQTELLSLLGRPQSAPASGAGPIASPARGDIVTDQHVALLLQQCCLTRHTGHVISAKQGGTAHSGGECYVFALPGAGAAIRSIDLGRREILGALSRKRHPEMLETMLAKRGLRRSAMGMRWHVRDLVGSGKLLRLETTVGILLRAAKR